MLLQEEYISDNGTNEVLDCSWPLAPNLPIGIINYILSRNRFAPKELELETDFLANEVEDEDEDAILPNELAYENEILVNLNWLMKYPVRFH